MHIVNADTTWSVVKQL